MATLRTVTVKPSGGNYTSVSAAEAGEQGNLVTLDRQLNIECYAMQDTTPVVVAGWTVDDTRYIKILTPSSERHDGKWNTSKYRLVVSNAAAFDLQISFVHIDGLQIQIAAVNGGDQDAVILEGTTNIAYISNTIMRGVSTTANYHSGLAIWDGGTVYLNNCILYDFQGAGAFNSGLQFYQGSGTVYVYGTTIQNCYRAAIHGGGTNAFLAKDVITQGCTVDTADWHASSDYNASSRADTVGTHSRNSQTFTFVNEASDDFHLASNDAGAKGYGVDLSSDANLPFNTDIDGQTRTASWDIGADQYVAAGGGQTLSPSGIASSEAFGTATIAPGPVTVSPTAIASAEAFGAATVTPGPVTVSPTGIASAEAIGAPQVNLSVSPTGIPTGEAFGAAKLSLFVLPSGIAGGEAFGTPNLALAILPTGIVSGEAFGNPTVTPGPVTLSPSGIVSGEAVGSPVLSNGGVVISVTGIGSAEALGTPTITPGTVTILPSGIGSGEALGTPTILTGVFILPSGISSAEAFGQLTVSPGPVTISPVGIGSGEALGNPLLSWPLFISVLGIPSSELVGHPVLNAIISNYMFARITMKHPTATITMKQPTAKFTLLN